MHNRAGILGLVAAASLLLTGCEAANPVYTRACRGTLATSTTGPITNPALTEISGIVASRRQPGIWWVHNDSGDTARIFAIGDDGATRGEFALTGSTNFDWEDIAIGPGPVAGIDYLYVSDTGDNALTRTEVQVYRVPEPAVAATAGAFELGGVETLRFRFPDGAKNAESLLVDPRNGQLMIVQKRSIGGPAKVYRAPANVVAGSLSTLTKVGTVTLEPGWMNAATGIDMSADARVIAVRTYAGVLVYRVGSGQSVKAALGGTACLANAAIEPQGEAIGFDADSLGFVTTSEGGNEALHHYDT